MTEPEECVQDTIDLVRTGDGKFMGAILPLGVADLPFVVSGTNILAIAKRRTQNALYIKIARGDAP